MSEDNPSQQPHPPVLDGPFGQVQAARLLDLAMDDDEEDLPEHQVGEFVGRYRLVKKLGEGGFGIVWQAEQTEPIRRQVAIKIVRPGMDTLSVLQRFRAERRALERMEHPNIATVLDAGSTSQGRPYFVLELVRGRPITRYAQEAHLDVRQRIELIVEVCRGVQHAHQRAVIHRDLKPSNILVAAGEGLAVPKVIDFGIAKALTDDVDGLGSLTKTAQGTVLGTPQYMAPEQAALGAEATDVRVDVYALGAILYELLTGSPPLEIDKERSTSLTVLLQRIHEEDVMLPSQRAHQRQAEGLYAPCAPQSLKGDLDWCLLKALEKRVEHRYASANSLADDLLRYLADEPVSAGPPGNWYRLQKLVRRNRTAFAVGAVLAVNLVVLAAVSTVAFWLEKDARGLADMMRLRAELKEKDAAAQSRKATILADFLERMLEQAGTFVEQGKNPEALRLALDDSLASVDEFRGEPALQVELLARLRTIYVAMGDGRRALPLTRRQVELSEALYGPAHRKTLEVMLTLARNLSDTGDHEGALQTYLDLDRRWQTHGRDGLPGRMEAQRQHARELARLKRGPEALALLKLCQPDAGSSVTQEGLVSHLRFEADILAGLDQHEDAARSLRKAAAVLRQNPSKENSRTLGQVLQTLSRAEAGLGRLEQAAQSLEESIRLETQMKGPTHHTLIGRWVEVSRHYLAMKQFDDAIRATDQAVAIARATGVGERLPKALRAAAEIREKAGQPQAALAFCRECMALERQHNTDRGKWLFELSEVVRLLSDLELHEEAEENATLLWKHFSGEPVAMGDPTFRQDVCNTISRACQRWQAATGGTAHEEDIRHWRALAAEVQAQKDKQAGRPQ